METTLTVSQGTFQLRRPGATARSPLRAWDAADEYVLNEIQEDGSSVLILNDAHGALAVALANREPTSMSDSFVALGTAQQNLAQNDRTGVSFLTSTEPIDLAPDVVIIKIPRTLSLLEHQLHQIREICSPDTRIIGAGMVKDVHSSTLQLFEGIIGPTTTSLAKKKARLVHPTFNPGLFPGANPWPQTVHLDAGFRVVVYPGVFAGTKLDIGARALLDALPDGYERAVDLGCGNGVIGTALARRSTSHVTFVDESYLAVESARGTFELNNPDTEASFVVDDAGAGLPTDSFDLVLNNPPFHDSNALTDATAWHMFKEARRMLVRDGELRVVANRHLGYHAKLKRLFGNCETVSSTKKFVVLSTRK